MGALLIVERQIGRQGGIGLWHRRRMRLPQTLLLEGAVETLNEGLVLRVVRAQHVDCDAQAGQAAQPGSGKAVTAATAHQARVIVTHNALGQAHALEEVQQGGQSLFGVILTGGQAGQGQGGAPVDDIENLDGVGLFVGYCRRAVHRCAEVHFPDLERRGALKRLQDAPGFG